jgi:hypothetical protein
VELQQPQLLDTTAREGRGAAHDGKVMNTVRFNRRASLERRGPVRARRRNKFQKPEFSGIFRMVFQSQKGGHPDFQPLTTTHSSPFPVFPPTLGFCTVPRSVFHARCPDTRPTSLIVNNFHPDTLSGLSGSVRNVAKSCERTRRFPAPGAWKSSFKF